VPGNLSAKKEDVAPMRFPATGRAASNMNEVGCEAVEQFPRRKFLE
jgi:hypothetical protein